MTAHVNLLSESYCTKRVLRRQGRVWGAVLLSALAVFCSWALLERSMERDVRDKRDALERQYAPLALIQDEVKQFEQTRDILHEREQFALLLSREKPLLTLLGLVSQAAKISDGRVYVRDFDYQSGGQQRARQAKATEQQGPSLSIRGVGSSNLAIAQFAAHLRDSKLFNHVELTASKSVATTGQARREYQLNCSLNPKAEL